MAILVKHAFQSTVPTDPAATAAGHVTPARWNEDHVVDVEDLVLESLTIRGASGGLYRLYIDADGNIGTEAI